MQLRSQILRKHLLAGLTRNVHWMGPLYRLYCLNLFLIGGQLFYDVMLVFAIQQCESAISIRLFPSSWASVPCPTPPHCSRSSQNTGFDSLYLYSKFPLAICFIHGNVSVSVLLSQFVPPSPFPAVFTSFLYLRLCSCPAIKFISTIFLNSIYLCWSTVFVSLFLTYFSLYNRLKVHLPP